MTSAPASRSGPASRVLLFHPGNPIFVQQAARALDEVHLLSAFVTSFHYTTNDALSRFLKNALKLVYAAPEKELRRREITEIGESRILTHRIPGFVQTAVAKSPAGPILADLVWESSEVSFDRIVAGKHLNGDDAVYGYEHAALSTFQGQKELGGLCIYDMPICHHQTQSEILSPEFQQFPITQTSYQRHLDRQAGRRNARKDKELALADLVVANSSFTKDSLVTAGVAEDRIAVIPYGAPPVRERYHPPKTPFIFLSAGTQSVRKGVHYLVQAWRQIAPVVGSELWLVGAMELPAQYLRDLPGRVVIKPSLPKEELFELYRKSSVLVFPSLAEGFGMVITEAMANGLPVITTTNTCGRDLIAHGRNGFLVPIRDVTALANTMQWCLDHPLELVEMGAEALRTAADWQWQDYRALLAKTVQVLLAARA